MKRIFETRVSRAVADSERREYEQDEPMIRVAHLAGAYEAHFHHAAFTIDAALVELKRGRVAEARKILCDWEQISLNTIKEPAKC